MILLFADWNISQKGGWLAEPCWLILG